MPIRAAGMHAEERQRRVAAADVRRVHEDRAEALVDGLLLERRALVRDGDEVLAGVQAVELCQPLVEIGMKAGRLRGAAGLAGDDEQGAAEVDLLLDRAHRVGVRAVQDAHVQEPVANAEDLAQHLRRQARAAHAEQDRVRVAVLAQPLDEACQLVEFGAHVLADRQPPKRVLDDPDVVRLALPQRGIALPQARHRAAPGERFERRARPRLRRLGELQRGAHRTKGAGRRRSTPAKALTEARAPTRLLPGARAT